MSCDSSFSFSLMNPKVYNKIIDLPKNRNCANHDLFFVHLKFFWRGGGGGGGGGGDGMWGM